MGTPVRHMLTAVFCVGLMLVAPTMVGCAAGTGGGGGGGGNGDQVDGGDGNINAGAGEPRTFSGTARCISAAGEAHCVCHEDSPAAVVITVSNGEITVDAQNAESVTVPLNADGTFMFATTITLPCGETQATGTAEAAAVLDESATPSTLALDTRIEGCDCVLEQEARLTEQ